MIGPQTYWNPLHSFDLYIHHLRQKELSRMTHKGSCHQGLRNKKFSLITQKGRAITKGSLRVSCQQGFEGKLLSKDSGKESCREKFREFSEKTRRESCGKGLWRYASKNIRGKRRTKRGMVRNTTSPIYPVTRLGHKTAQTFLKGIPQEKGMWLRCCRSNSVVFAALSLHHPLP